MSHPTEEDWKRILKMVDIIYQRPDAEPFREPVPWKALGLTDYPTIISKPLDLGTIKEKIKKRTVYKTLYQVNDDVRTVWSNCMTYNADGSDFYKLAELLKKKWDEKYNKLINDISTGQQQHQLHQGPPGSNNLSTTSTTTTAGGGGPDSIKSELLNGVPSSSLVPNNNSSSFSSSTTTTNMKSTLSDKRNFAKLLYQISKEELGKVLVDVESRHPSAIKRNATEDEVILNIDEIPAPLLQELHAFVISVKGQKKKSVSSSGTKNKKAKTS